MNILATLFIFLLALFLYIYLMHQFKKSQDLEVFEMDYSDNAHLQEVCDIRQPVIFDFRPVCWPLFEEISPQNLAKYGGQTVEMKNTQDYYNNLGSNSKNTNVDSVSIKFSTAKALCESDDQGRYFSENNGELLGEVGIASKLGAEMDPWIKPAFNLKSYHDLLFGSPGTATPLQYHTYYRRFLCVSLGKIHVKMLPWNKSTMLNPLHDYEHYEFRSMTNPRSLVSDVLEFDVYQGSMLFIPPYWWYSIEYTLDRPETLVYSVSYMTVMNLVANTPNLGLYWLQQQNIVSKVSKISNISDDPRSVAISDVVLEKENSVNTHEEVLQSGAGQSSNDIPADQEEESKADVEPEEKPNPQVVKLDSVKPLMSKVEEEVISVNNI